MMQLERPVFVIFSIDLECMWDFSAFVRELLCYQGLQPCLTRAAAVLGIVAFSCPILLDQFPNRNTSSRASIRLCVQMCCVVWLSLDGAAVYRAHCAKQMVFL